MPDNTYSPGIYRGQGGDSLLIKSSGTLTNEGTITSTGTVVLGPVAAATTSANLPAGGVSLVTATSAAGAQVFTIDRPVVGQSKWISCTVANATDICTVIGPSTTTLFGAGVGLPKLRFVLPGTVQLVGYTTNVYHFVPISTAIAYATTAA